MPRPSLLDLFTELGAHPDDVADAVGVHRTTVYAWLSGHQEPRTTRYRAIAEAIGATVREVSDALEETHRRATAGKK